MSKYIKSFNDATSMRAYLDTAEGMKYYLLKNEAGEDGIGAIPESGKKIVSLFKGRDYLTFTAVEANSSIKFGENQTVADYWTSVEYSIDGGINWIDGKMVTVTLANIGDKVCYRGVIGTIPSGSDSRFIIYGKVSASGSIMSMYNNNPNDTVISIDDAFRRMFMGNPITTAPELPATTLSSYCYWEMFSGCRFLTQAPELPATTLAGGCYNAMFENCSSLTQAPELPATTLPSNSIKYMFDGCSLLNYVKHHITNWNTSYAQYWLRGTAATGIVECPTGCTIPSDSTMGVPTGWTKIEF